MSDDLFLGEFLKVDASVYLFSVFNVLKRNELFYDFFKRFELGDVGVGGDFEYLLSFVSGFEFDFSPEFSNCFVGFFYSFLDVYNSVFQGTGFGVLDLVRGVFLKPGFLDSWARAGESLVGALENNFSMLELVNEGDYSFFVSVKDGRPLAVPGEEVGVLQSEYLEKLFEERLVGIDKRNDDDLSFYE